MGFSLSNKKILSTGFKFLYTLDESIKEMILNGLSKLNKRFRACKRWKQ